MANYQSAFERYIKACEKAGDATLRWWYQRQMIMDNLNAQRDYDKLVEDVAQYVMAHISATVDIEEAVLKIQELNDEIRKLGE